MPLPADMVFAVMGLSNCLMRLLGFQLAFCIQTVSEGFVTIERIRNFLLLPDKKSSRLLEEGPPDPEHAVVGCVKSLSASYDTKAPPVLSAMHVIHAIHAIHAHMPSATPYTHACPRPACLAIGQGPVLARYVAQEAEGESEVQVRSVAPATESAEEKSSLVLRGVDFSLSAAQLLIVVGPVRECEVGRYRQPPSHSRTACPIRWVRVSRLC